MPSSSIPGTDAHALRLPGFAPPPTGGAGAPVPEEMRACMERAGRLLARRARSERELRDRLVEAEFETGIVDAAIERLAELCLVDDHDFARRWIEERSVSKGRGPAILRAELAAKGVDGAVIEAALVEADLDEVAMATAAAAKLVRKVARKPLQAQAASLWQTLRRKGYSSEACEAAVKAVLPPEGWD
jgi:regulatory protein